MKTRVITAAVAVLALVGCSGSPAPSGPASVGASVDPGRVSPTDLPTPPAVKNPQGAVRDLTLGDCKTEAGEQIVSGEVKSSQADAADFLITVSWTTPTGDVMGRGFAVVRDLKPGASKTFEIKAKVAAGATQCVPGVEFGSIKK